MRRLNAHPIHKRAGRHGTIVVWQVEDGTHVASSSAHHQLLPSSANDSASDTAWLARLFVGTLHNGDMVSETVVFHCDEHGEFSSFDTVAQVMTHESHSEAMQAAGFDPAPIPTDLPIKEKNHE